MLASIGYPFIVHTLVVMEEFLFAGFYIVVLLLLVSLQNISQGHKGLAAGLFILSVAVTALLVYQAQWVIFLPPVIIPLILAVIFGQTLLGGHTAFITSIAKKIRKVPLTEKEKSYTRVITQLWVVFFLFLAVESAVVALLADIETWSYITNFLNYILVLIFAIGEFLLRRIILNDLEHPGFIGFVKQLIDVQRSH